MTTKLKPAYLHKKSKDPNKIHFSYLVQLNRKDTPEQVDCDYAKIKVGLVLGTLKRANEGFIIDKLAYNTFQYNGNAWHSGVKKPACLSMKMIRHTRLFAELQTISSMCLHYRRSLIKW